MLTDTDRYLLTEAKKGLMLDEGEMRYFHDDVRRLKDIGYLRCGVSSSKERKLQETFHITKLGLSVLRGDTMSRLIHGKRIDCKSDFDPDYFSES